MPHQTLECSPTYFQAFGPHPQSTLEVLLMCLLGYALPKGAVPLPFLTEVPNAQSPIRYMGSFVSSRLTKKDWPRAWGTGLLSRSPVHGIENLSLVMWVAS